MGWDNVCGGGCICEALGNRQLLKLIRACEVINLLRLTYINLTFFINYFRTYCTYKQTLILFSYHWMHIVTFSTQWHNLFSVNKNRQGAIPLIELYLSTMNFQQCPSYSDKGKLAICQFNRYMYAFLILLHFICCRAYIPKGQHMTIINNMVKYSPLPFC